MLRAQGWPEDATSEQPQPLVTVRAGGRTPETVVGTFTPVSTSQEYRFSIPASARTSADLIVELDTSATFGDTEAYADPRPKGIRVDRVVLLAAPPSGFTPAGLAAVLQLAGGVLLLTIAARRLSGHVAAGTIFGAGLALAGATLLALLRPWIAPVLPAFLAAGVVAFAVASRGPLLHWGQALWARLRGGEVPWLASRAAMVAGALLIMLTALTRLPTPAELRGDSARLLQLVASLVLAGLLLAAGPTVLPPVLRVARGRLLAGKLAALLLCLVGGAILAWELQLLRAVPIVGHADYADNAVVARSLLRGQGWTVPYVTQFYKLEPGGSVYRPQETWPLLQPVWMLPFMAILGPTAFAARVPNLLFNLALLLLIYHIGSRIWDRRVGLLAAVLTLLNHFFFRLTLYSTTDLGFTVLSMGAIWFFFRAWSVSKDGPLRSTIEVAPRTSTGPARPAWLGHPYVLWAAAGVLGGLMSLQKPTGAIFGAGMFLWALLHWWRGRRSAAATPRLPWRGLLLWTGVAALVVMPYIARNLLLWGRPFFSTESYDAWILGYRGTGKDAWEEIYRVYLGDLPNRSWILRAGWDRTFQKFLTQVEAVLAYLLPTDGKLLGVAFTWLALAGCLVLRRRQRQLVSLVALPGVLYVLFLTTYWHADEERYFVPFVPWLLLLAMAGLCAAFDYVLAHNNRRWDGLAGGLAMLLLLSGVAPHLRQTAAMLDPSRGSYWGRDWLPDLRAFAWLKANTRPDEVVMTRVPWQLSWEADRPSVMIPNAPLTAEDPQTPTIMRAARYYGADYLVVNAGLVSGGEAGAALQPLSQGESILGFTPVYTGTAELGRVPIRIYRFPQDYAGASPLTAENAP